MRDVRPEFTPKEYHRLQIEADRLCVSVKQLVHDRAVGISTADTPLNSAKILTDEITKTREVLNEIIKREMTADVRLYEDDIIRLEMSMTELEGIVTACVAKVLKEMKRYGNTEI